MQDAPLVSVIIPTYNRAHIINRAIESVLSQTLIDWELIIVDDGSVDDTWSLLEKYARENNNIKVYRHEKNKGISAARNTAIGHSRGTYLAFLDSDDTWFPEKLQKQIAVFKQGPPDLGLVYTGAIFINERTGISRVKHARIQGKIFQQQLAFNPIGGPSRVMVSRESFISSGSFDEQPAFFEDWDLWIRITKKYQVAAISEPLVNYLESDDSISVNTDKLITVYKMLWHKYNIEQAPRWIRGAHYLRLGHRLCYFNAMTEGRGYLLKAVFVTPWKLKHVIVFLLSLLGNRPYRAITFFAMKIAG
jgi:glycosyltransferase involved in cell wall biosynthesis